MAARFTLIFVVLLTGCAVPVPPSGGPPDSQPPRVVRTEPADGSVNTRPASVLIQFDEFIDPRSAGAAVSMTPEPDRLPEIKPGGKSIEVVFRESLRDNTTYIITVDTGLRDAHGVTLTAPIRVAFATGDRINTSRIDGSVIRSRNGNPDPGLDVFAYLRPDGAPPAELPNASTPPDYRTQTDPAGKFSFQYLQEATYFVVGIRDGNRNKTADPGEDLAWPPLPLVVADSDSTNLGVWMSARVDTTGPRLRRATSLSQQRIELSFDSDVHLLDLDPSRWEILDTLTLQTAEVLSVYQPLADRRKAVLVTNPIFGANWEVWAEGVAADSSGNVGVVGPTGFTASARLDTFRTRFQGFRLDTLAVDGAFSILSPGSSPGLAFSLPPGDAAVLNSVAVSDTANVSLPWTIRSSTGTTIFVEVESAADYRIDVDLNAFGGRDSTASVWVRRAPISMLGELAGFVSLGTEDVHIRALEDGDRQAFQTVADSTGAFRFDGLPGGSSFRLELFEDTNKNGRWDFGQLRPFSPPELRGWHDQAPQVRAKWETVIPDTLRLLPLLPLIVPVPTAPDSTSGSP
jgi:Bacterial Ig-like domain